MEVITILTEVAFSHVTHVELWPSKHLLNMVANVTVDTSDAQIADLSADLAGTCRLGGFGSN